MSLILITLVRLVDGSFSRGPNPEAAFLTALSATGSFMKTREKQNVI